MSADLVAWHRAIAMLPSDVVVRGFRWHGGGVRFVLIIDGVDADLSYYNHHDGEYSGVFWNKPREGWIRVAGPGEFPPHTTLTTTIATVRFIRSKA